MKIGVLNILCLTFLLAAAATAAPRETVFPDDRTLGNPKAPVVIVEYLAPTCPYCAHFAADVFPEIKKAYIDTGKALFVLRIFPLSQADGAVAGLAKCQQPERYYDFLDLAFKKQAMWDPDGYQIPDVEAALIQLAGMAGLKPDEAKRCMHDEQEFDRIDKLSKDAVERYHVEGVPTLVVDGTVVPDDATSWPALKARIDGALAKN